MLHIHSCEKRKRYLERKIIIISKKTTKKFGGLIFLLYLCSRKRTITKTLTTMTQKEFIKKFGIICDQNHTNGINLNMDNVIQMRFDCYHNSEVINDCVSEIGFYEGDFYITFILSNFTAYEDELESNTEDDWSMLWEAVLNYFDCDDFDIHNFKPGDTVYWNDPNINDYPEDEREELLKRRFVVFAVNYDIISISDTYSEAEVYANELTYIS